MALTIDELQIEIQAKGAESASGIDALTTSLGALKKMINKSLIGKLESLSSALDGIKAPITVNMNVKGMEQLRESIKSATSNISAGAISPSVDGSAVSGELDKISGSAAQAAGELEQLSSPATKVASELRATGKSAGDAEKKLKEVGKSAKQGASGLNKFVSSLKRILMYRVVRSILSNIASAAKEGIQNLVLYSKAIGGIDASKANATMSQFASIGMQVKNTLGSALMPVLNALMPVIQTLANWFIIAANAVNQFFAAISGASTWSKAKEYAVDYADSLGKAAGAASDLKNAMLGIDELNVISPNSGGGGGGAGALDYGDMFEEIPINQTLADLALKIKDIFFDWEDLTLNDIIDKVVVGLGMVTGAAIGWSVGGFSGAVIGAVIGAGLGLAITELLPDFENLSANDIKNLIVAGLAGVTGFVVGFGIGGLPGGLLGFMIGAGISLSFDKLIAKVEPGQEWKSVILNAVKLGLLGAGIGFLAGGPFGALIGFGVGAYLSIVFQGLTSNWSEMTEKIKGWAQKVRERIEGIWGDEETPLIQKFFESGVALVAGLLGGIWSIKHTLGDWLWDNLAKPIIDGVKKLFGINSPSTVFAEIGRNLIAGLLSGVSETWNSVVAFWDTSMSAWWANNISPWFTKDKWVEAGKGLVDGFKETWKNAVNTGIELFNKFISWINSKMKFSWPSAPLLGIKAGSVQLFTIPKIPKFEFGGFPADGQLFVARERGPEMVGTMGRRTAVANNDQIVQAVSEGVYEAVVAAMNGRSDGGGEYNFYLEGKPLEVSVTRRQNSGNRMYGRTLQRV